MKCNLPIVSFLVHWWLLQEFNVGSSCAVFVVQILVACIMPPAVVFGWQQFGARGTTHARRLIWIQQSPANFAWPHPPKIMALLKDAITILQLRREPSAALHTGAMSWINVACCWHTLRALKSSIKGRAVSSAYACDANFHCLRCCGSSFKDGWLACLNCSWYCKGSPKLQLRIAMHSKSSSKQQRALMCWRLLRLCAILAKVLVVGWSCLWRLLLLSSML